MYINKDRQALSLFLPDKTLEYFDITESTISENKKEISITLEEKNNPPMEFIPKGVSVTAKDFQEINITDFPVRNRTVTLVFRRRRWTAGDKIITRDIQLQAAGTKLSYEFGQFLKRYC